MSRVSSLQSRRDILRAVWLTLAVFVAALIGIELTRESGRVASIWLANAVVVLALLQTSKTKWAGWLLCGLAGNLAANMVTGDTSLLGTTLALCNTIEILLVGWLFLAWDQAGRPDLTRFRSLFRFMFIGGLVGPAISGALAAFALHVGQSLPFWVVFKTWVPADALGLLILVPLFAGTTGKGFLEILKSPSRLEALGILVLIPVVATAIVLGEQFRWLFLLMPVFLWSTYRFGFVGAASAIFLAAASSLGSYAYMASHVGQVIHVREEILYLQILLFSNVLICLPIANLITALKKIGVRHRSILETTQDGFWIADSQGRLREVNAAYSQMSGYSQQDLLSMNIADLDALESPGQTIAHMQHILVEGSDQFETRHRRKDGSTFEVEISVQGNAQGEDAFIVFIRDITERKRAESALKGSEQRYRIVADYTYNWEYWLAPNGSLLWMSPSCERITGYPVDSFQRDPDLLHRICHPEDRVLFVDHVHESNENGRFSTVEYRIQHRDGHQIWLSHLCVPVVDDQGKPAGRRASNRDITERKQAEQTIRTAEQKLDLHFKQAPLGVIEWDLDFRVTRWNPAAERIFGYSAAEAIGQHATFIIPEPAHPFVEPIMKALLEGRGGERSDNENVHKNGTILQCVWYNTTLKNEEGEVLGAASLVDDITARKMAEAELRESHQRMQLATESACLAVWDWDLRAGTMVWDDRMFQLYGTTREAIHGTVQDWKDGLHPEDLEQAVRECEAAIKGESPFDTEFRVINPDGKIRWVKANAIVLRDSEGNPVRMIGLNRDITDLHQADEEKATLQAQLLQSQKMESLGTLAGGVAHDMNNVLGAILGLASAHIGTQPYGSPLHKALDTICKATERGGKMVKSLLTFARQNPVESQQFDLNAVIMEQVGLLERTTLSKVQMRMALEPELRPMRGDSNAIAHALMNLCVNAVDAMTDNGTLTIQTCNVDSDWLEAVVEDTGMGMSKEVLAKALDPFFTTKGTGKGTGLGLSMVFSTVKAHQGQLSIQSEPGKGTRVLLRFPACEHEAQTEKFSDADSTQNSLGTKRALLVDDDELIQSSFKAIFESLGNIEVTIAKSGEEALDLLEAGLELDFIVLDMNMPGLGGAGTLPLLRSLRPEVPVLLSTGRIDQSAIALASAYPGVTILSKPFGLRELERHLQTLGIEVSI